MNYVMSLAKSKSVSLSTEESQLLAIRLSVILFIAVTLILVAFLLLVIRRLKIHNIELIDQLANLAGELKMAEVYRDDLLRVIREQRVLIDKWTREGKVEGYVQKDYMGLDD